MCGLQVQTCHGCMRTAPLLIRSRRLQSGPGQFRPGNPFQALMCMRKVIYLSYTSCTLMRYACPLRPARSQSGIPRRVQSACQGWKIWPEAAPCMLRDTSLVMAAGRGRRFGASVHSGPSEDPAAASEGLWEGAHAGLASSGALRLFLKSPADNCTQEDSVYPT